MAKKYAAFLLAVIMTLSLCPLNVLASETDSVASETSVEEVSEEVSEGVSEEVPEEPDDGAAPDEEYAEPPAQELPMTDTLPEEPPMMGEALLGDPAAHIHDMGTADTSDDVTFLPWENTTSLPLSGSYYLTDNVTLNNEVVLNGTLNLCLNGYVIRQSGSYQRVFNISNGKTLNLYECNTEAVHYYKYSKTGAWTWDDDTTANAIEVSEITDSTENGTPIIVRGGAAYSTNQGGAAVLVKGAGSTFVMNGGNLVGNRVQQSGGSWEGGTVMARNDGVFTLNGGTIQGNYSGTQGGGVFVYDDSAGYSNATFTMNGGLIRYNRGNDGGGVYIRTGTFTMSGGTIRNCSSNGTDNSGAVFDPATASREFGMGAALVGGIMGGIGGVGNVIADRRAPKQAPARETATVTAVPDTNAAAQTADSQVNAQAAETMATAPEVTVTGQERAKRETPAWQADESAAYRRAGEAAPAVSVTPAAAVMEQTAPAEQAQKAESEYEVQKKAQEAILSGELDRTIASLKKARDIPAKAPGTRIAAKAAQADEKARIRQMAGEVDTPDLTGWLPNASETTKPFERDDSFLYALNRMQAYGEDTPYLLPQDWQIAEEAQKNTAGEAENNKGESEEILFKLRNAIPEINMEPVENNSSDMLNNVVGKTMAEKGWNIFRNILGTITRSKFGEIIIDTTSIKDDLGHGIGPAKAATIKAVPAVIKNGKQIDFQPNWKNRGYDTFVFAAPTTLDGKTVYVAAVVKQSKQNNKFYLHEVIDSNGNIIKISTKFAANPTGLAAESGARTANQVLEDTIPQPAAEVKNNRSTEGGVMRTVNGQTYDVTTEEDAKAALEAEKAQAAEQEMTEFRGTNGAPAGSSMEKLGVNVTGDQGDYRNVAQVRANEQAKRAARSCSTS